MKQALDQGRIATDYCLFTNCFDVLFVTSPEEILQRFLDLQHMNNGLPSIMFGAEKNCFPSGGETALHPQGFTSYRYLNSGWYIGETQSIAQALKEMNPEENILDDHKDEKGEWVYDNDQSHWQRQMLNGTVPIGLDTECQLVWNMHAVKESEADLSGSRPQCIETHSYPMVLHLNGAASHVWKDKLIAHLGLA
jgi:hypothetical protein